MVAAATVWTGLWVMTWRPGTYRIVVDGEAWPRAGATLRTSEPASTALVANVQSRVRVQTGAVAAPADEAVRSSQVHRHCPNIQGATQEANVLRKAIAARVGGRLVRPRTLRSGIPNRSSVRR